MEAVALPTGKEGLNNNIAPPGLSTVVHKSEGIKIKEKAEMKLQVKEDGNGLDCESVLGKRMVRSKAGDSDAVEGRESSEHEKCKKPRGAVSGEGACNSDEIGGREATDPGATGELAGADERTRQEG